MSEHRDDRNVRALSVQLPVQHFMQVVVSPSRYDVGTLRHNTANIMM